MKYYLKDDASNIRFFIQKDSNTFDIYSFLKYSNDIRGIIVSLDYQYSDNIVNNLKSDNVSKDYKEKIIKAIFTQYISLKSTERF